MSQHICTPYCYCPKSDSVTRTIVTVTVTKKHDKTQVRQLVFNGSHLYASWVPWDSDLILSVVYTQKEAA